MRYLLTTAAAIASWFVFGHFHLAILAYIAVTCLATANTAKTRETEARVTALAGSVGTINQTVKQHAQGTFSNVAGGGTVQLTGNGTMSASALSNLNSSSQTSFLAGISAMPSPSDIQTGSPSGWDSNTGSSWATGERGYINGIHDSVDTFYGWIRASGLCG